MSISERAAKIRRLDFYHECRQVGAGFERKDVAETISGLFGVRVTPDNLSVVLRGDRALVPAEGTQYHYIVKFCENYHRLLTRPRSEWPRAGEETVLSRLIREAYEAFQADREEERKAS